MSKADSVMVPKVSVAQRLELEILPDLTRSSTHRDQDLDNDTFA